MTDFFLVIPAYREHDRLPGFLQELISTLAPCPFTTTVQIVDDGSPQVSTDLLLKRISSCKSQAALNLAPVLVLNTHQGKGHCIQAGWNEGEEARYLAFVDADGAIPASEIRRVFLRIYQLSAPEPECCFCAIRLQGSEHILERNWLRHVASRLFATTIHWICQTRVRDTQCGFKILSQSTWKRIQSRCCESGYCFDIELLMRLQLLQIPIHPIPVRWQEKPGGQLRLFQDGIQMLAQAFALRLRLEKVIRETTTSS